MQLLVNELCHYIKECAICFLFMFYCAVMSDIFNYIYYKVLNTQVCVNDAEPVLLFNRSVFMLIAALSLTFQNSELGSF